MPVDRSRLDRLQQQLDTVRERRATASARFEHARAEEEQQRERRIEATRRGDEITSIDQRIGRLRSQQGIEAQAIEVLDRDIAAAEAAVVAEKERVERALAEEQEAVTASAIDEAYAALEQLAVTLTPLRDRAFAEHGSSMRLWGGVSNRERGNLTLRSNAQDRLERGGKLHCLRMLGEVMQRMQVIAGTAPEPERRAPVNPWRNVPDQQVIELPPPLNGIVIRSKEESAARVRRFDFGQKS